MKKAVRWILAVGVSAAGLWWALRGMDVARLGEAWKGARSLWLLALIPAGMGLEFLFRSLRWSVLLRRGHGLSRGRIFAITSGGFFLNNVLPFRAGEAARLFWTWRGTGRPAAACAAVLGLDRLFDMLAVATLLLWVMAGWSGFPGSGRSAALFGGVAGAGVLFLWGMAVRPDLAASLARKLRLPERPRIWVEEFARGAAPLADWRVFVSMHVLSAGFWALNAGLFAAASRVFGLGLSWTEGAALALSFAAGAALPSAPGYVGVLEAAGVSLLLAAGRPRPEAGAFVLTLHAGQILSTALYGVPSLFFLGGTRRG